MQRRRTDESVNNYINNKRPSRSIVPSRYLVPRRNEGGENHISQSCEQVRPEVWASYLARRMGEPDRSPYYLRLFNQYPLKTIKQALKQCLKTPDEDIRKSRAALFIYLLKHYDQRRNTHPGHLPQQSGAWPRPGR